jgi:Zn-dependent membrane protease YugP
MSSFNLYILYFIVPLVIGLVVQARLKRTFAVNSQKPVASGKSGAEVAREILDRNGLHSVPVQPSKAGPLSDHYDPRSRGVFLSEPVFAGRSVAATAVAAHEVGHALQHAKAYVPMTLRSAVWPLAAFGSQAWFFLLIAGVIFQFTGLITVALIVFGFAVLFQFVTLPVEFNASRRAAVMSPAAPGPGAGERRRGRGRAPDAHGRRHDLRGRRSGLGRPAALLPGDLRRGARLTQGAGTKVGVIWAASSALWSTTITLTALRGTRLPPA